MTVTLEFVPTLPTSISHLSEHGTVHDFVMLTVFARESLSPLRRRSGSFGLTVSSTPVTLVSMVTMLESSDVTLCESF